MLNDWFEHKRRTNVKRRDRRVNTNEVFFSAIAAISALIVRLCDLY
jgi:hypothetical protein